MATPNYEINYDDERFTQVEAEKETALNNINNTYNNMISQSDKFYDDQKAAIEDYKNTQSQLQQQQSDLTIEKLENEKAQAEKDYTKEQSGAYVDWQKQLKSNEQAMADMGLANTGFSESSQISMYNTYQNRVATARESFNQAVTNYNLAIKDAQVANSSKLAEIAFNAYKTQLELSLEGFQYKNQLLQTQIEQQQQTEDRYYSRWQDVLGQMNQENQFAESIRQYEQNYKLQQEQFAEEKRQFELSYNQQVKEFNENIRQFNEEIARLKKKDAEEYAMEIQRLELQKQQVEQAKIEADREYQLKVQQMNQSQSNWEKEYALAKKSAGGGGGGGSAAINKDGSGGIDKDGKAEVNTQYYSGALNPDTQYGTFANTVDSNGVRYQPNNVGGSKLSKTGLTIENNGVTQNVWKSEKGYYYYWEGRQNKYISIPANQIKGLQTMKNASGGGFR